MSSGCNKQNTEKNNYGISLETLIRLLSSIRQGFVIYTILSCITTRSSSLVVSTVSVFLLYLTHSTLPTLLLVIIVCMVTLIPNFSLIMIHKQQILYRHMYGTHSPFEHFFLISFILFSSSFAPLSGVCNNDNNNKQKPNSSSLVPGWGLGTRLHNGLKGLRLEDHDFYLHKGEFRDALCLRYGWSLSNTPHTCNCGTVQ